MVGTDTSAPGAPGPRQVIEHIMAQSPVMRWLDVEIIDVEPGYTRMAIVVRADIGNIHGSCHGGLIFTLADIAFGMAAQAGNDRAVSASAEIQFLSPAPVGSRLLAEAREVWRRGKNGIYDVTLSTETGETVALVRGRMRFIGGQHMPATGGPCVTEP